MGDLYRHRYKCQTCGTVTEDVFRTAILTECPTNSEHTLDEVTLVETRYEETPADRDGRRVMHVTPRTLGTYTYYTGTEDDPDDHQAVGGDEDEVQLFAHHHVPSTVSLSNLARASNIATATTSTDHGRVEGDIVEVDSNDSDYNGTDITIVSVPSSTTFTYANTGDDEDSKSATGTVSGHKKYTFYGSFNTIDNETHIYSGVITWKGALNDMITMEIVPKLTTYSAGTDTNFNLYAGIMIVPAAGDGLVSVDAEDMVLVQCVPNEFGVRPVGFWNATFNTTTGEFSAPIAAPLGDGEYNMFTYEMVFARFVNKLLMLGDTSYVMTSHDTSQLGHGGRCKITLRTIGEDHNWWWNANMQLYRKKTT